MRALLIVLVLALTASAAEGRDACARGVRYRGAVIDLDLKDADVQDVFRMLAKLGGVNVVVSDDVRGRVTVTLKRVPWDQAACTIAAVHRLHLELDGNMLLITATAKAP